MNIFNKRPLSLILCVSLGGFIFFQLMNVTIASVVSVLLAIAFVFSFLKISKKITKIAFTRALIIAVLMSFLCSFIYFDLRFDAPKRFDDEDVVIHGIITDMNTDGVVTEIDIETDNINSTFLSSYKLKSYLDSSKFYNFSTGSEIEIIGKIKNFNNENDKYYISQGYSGIITDIESFKLLSSANFTIEYYIKSYRESITRKIVLNTDKETGGLLSAILLGDRSYLSGQTNLDFSRIGISHILALSGMHLAILILGIEKLLGIIGINKRIRYVISILLTIFYVALTGFPISVVRAGLMLVIRSVLHLFSRTHDSITSLSIAVFLICVIDPCAIYDIALWLSAFATLGILVYSEYSKEHISRNSVLGKLKNAMLISVFPISATLIFTTVSFSNTSLFAPVTTIIFTFLIEIFLYIGMLVPFVGDFAPIKSIVVSLGDLISCLAGKISDIDFGFVSTRFPAVTILIVALTVVFIAFAIIKIKGKRRVAMIITSLYFLTLITSALLTYQCENEERICYENYGEQEIIKLTNNKTITIFDVASYRGDTAYAAISSVKSDNLTKIDNYIMFRYSYKMKDAILQLCRSIKTHRIYMPSPKTKEEQAIYDSVVTSLKSYRTEIITYSNDSYYEIENFILLSTYSGALSNNETSIMFTIVYKSKAYSYLSGPTLEGKLKAAAQKIMSQSENIIIGGHGNVKGYIFNYKLNNVENIVFASSEMKIGNDLIQYYKNSNLHFLPEKVSFIH